MKRFKRLTAFVLALMVILAPSITAMAMATDEVKEAGESVFQVNLLYENQNGKEYLLQGGSGFLIGETSGAEYVITSAHVVNMDDQIKEAESEIFGVDFFSSDVNLKIKVVVEPNVEINATIVNQSDTMDFAILKLEQPIYDRKPLSLNSNMDAVKEEDFVRLLGFQVIFDSDQGVSGYGHQGGLPARVSKTTLLDGVGYIQHSRLTNVADYVSFNGPLVNDRGEVIGLNRIEGWNEEEYSLHISEVTKVLNTLEIPYIEVGENSPAEQEPVQEPEETPAPQETATEVPAVSNEAVTVDKTVLSSELAAAQAIDITKYNDESATALTGAIANGNAVIADSSATQTEVDSALTTLRNAQSSMVEKSGSNMTLLIIVVAAVALILVIVLIVVLSGRKKKNRSCV